MYRTQTPECGLFWCQKTFTELWSPERSRIQTEEMERGQWQQLGGMNGNSVKKKCQGQSVLKPHLTYMELLMDWALHRSFTSNTTRRGFCWGIIKQSGGVRGWLLKSHFIKSLFLTLQNIQKEVSAYCQDNLSLQQCLGRVDQLVLSRLAMTCGPCCPRHTDLRVRWRKSRGNDKAPFGGMMAGTYAWK